MTDPFEVLRIAAPSVDPDPAFALELRARLERALRRPRGVIPVTDRSSLVPDAPERAQPPRAAAVPYLAVADAGAAIDWYVDVFAAAVVGEPIVMPDGRIGHAELDLDGGVLYLADEHPELGVVAPVAGAASVSLMLPVGDADEVRARALAAGATGDRPPYDGYGTRNAWIVDPFGHRWGLSSPLPSAAADPAWRDGDVVYTSLALPDGERARRFYADALGWRFADDRVLDVAPDRAVRTAADGGPTLFCCYAVTDLDAARERVAAAGGTAGEVQHRPFGTVVDCVDDQGESFALFAIEPDAGGARPPVNGSRPGDLAYLTLEVVDSARTRAFYGSVLGWQFDHGRIEDGWQVRDTSPMIGLSGGATRARAVPMWLVSDVAAAVEGVRRAGGTATDPERQPYGITSDCTDDQGVRFYLGEL